MRNGLLLLTFGKVNAMKSFVPFLICIALTLGAQFCLDIVMRPKSQPCAKAEVSPPEIFDPSSIKLIRCGDLQGTAEVVQHGIVITASHVVAGQTFCSIGNKEFYVTHDDPALDYAILDGDTGLSTPMAMDCRPLDGVDYTATGYPGDFRMTTPLHGLETYADVIEDADKNSHIVTHLNELSGEVLHGMSGGAVLDTTNTLRGIVISQETTGRVSNVRELRDTLLCRGDEE